MFNKIKGKYIDRKMKRLWFWNFTRNIHPLLCKIILVKRDKWIICVYIHIYIFFLVANYACRSKQKGSLLKNKCLSLRMPLGIWKSIIWTDWSPSQLAILKHIIFSCYGIKLLNIWCIFLSTFQDMCLKNPVISPNWPCHITPTTEIYD